MIKGITMTRKQMTEALKRPNYSAFSFSFVIFFFSLFQQWGRFGLDLAWITTAQILLVLLKPQNVPVVSLSSQWIFNNLLSSPHSFLVCAGIWLCWQQCIGRKTWRKGTWHDIWSDSGLRDTLQWTQRSLIWAQSVCGWKSLKIKMILMYSLWND